MVKIIIYKHFYSYLGCLFFLREGKNEENKEETKKQKKDRTVNHKWATEHTH